MNKTLTLAILLSCLVSCATNSSNGDNESSGMTNQTVWENVYSTDGIPDDDYFAQMTSTLYIGLGNQFEEVLVSHNVVDFSQEGATEEYLYFLIAEMSKETSWFLRCEITAYKSIGVGFKKSSSLFVSPLAEQKYFAHDGYVLAEMILDSVQKTIQENLTSELGNPEALDVFFFMYDDTPLIFEEIGMYIPQEEPYQGLVPIPES